MHFAASSIQMRFMGRTRHPHRKYSGRAWAVRTRYLCDIARREGALDPAHRASRTNAGRRIGRARCTVRGRLRRAAPLGTSAVARGRARCGAGHHLFGTRELFAVRECGRAEALEELAQAEPRLAQVAQMRYFGGYSEMEIAETLDVTERTVQRDWEKARLILAETLR